MIFNNYLNCLIIFELYFYLRGRGEVWSSRLPVTQEVAGSNPVVPAIRPDSSVGRALIEKQGVGSSILPLATIIFGLFVHYKQTIKIDD